MTLKGPSGPSGPSRGATGGTSASALLNDLKGSFNAHLGVTGATGPGAVPLTKEQALEIVARTMWDHRDHITREDLEEIWRELQVRDVMES